MSTENFHDFVNRLSKLKGLFHAGQHMLPLIEELFDFIVEIIPVLEGINKSIEVSSSKLPKASTELSNVTKATEMATIEILNTLDTISQEVMDTTTAVQNLMTFSTNAHNNMTEALEELQLIAQKNPHIVKAMNLLSSANTLDAEAKEKFDFAEQQLSNISQHTNEISISLQVQDITSQQIAAVNQLVASVHSRFSQILERLDGPQIDQKNEFNKGQHPKVFDPNATYTKSDELQKLADTLSVIHQDPKKEVESVSVATQAEVDRLFRS